MKTIFFLSFLLCSTMAVAQDREYVYLGNTYFLPETGGVEILPYQLYLDTTSFRFSFSPTQNEIQISADLLVYNPERKELFDAQGYTGWYIVGETNRDCCRDNYAKSYYMNTGLHFPFGILSDYKDCIVAYYERWLERRKATLSKTVQDTRSPQQTVPPTSNKPK